MTDLQVGLEEQAGHADARSDQDSRRAIRYERQIGRRGILKTLERVRSYVEPAVGTRQ